ncbi:MAG: ssDNA-binding domain-containing protein [Mycoplasmataceae bacterium]|nr:ssDNA-binding domain-containing protein [Mycoplasmataceae bacterium]
MEKSKVREKLVELYTKSLEENEVPWRKTWNFVAPFNPVTKKKYNGVNFLALKTAQKEDPRWLTFNQAKQKGWNVKPGEKAMPVEFWSVYDTKNKKAIDWESYNKLTLEEKLEGNYKMMVKNYVVFNGSQIEKIPPYVKENENNIKLSDVEEKFLPTLIKNMEIKVIHTVGDSAHYSPSKDEINIPYKENFEDSYSYSATLLHELGHASGSVKRLNRDLSGKFGSESYAKEELRAEIAASFVAGEINLDPNKAQEDTNHKAYVQNWIKVLKEQPNELFKAINDAWKIADYLEEKGELKQILGKEKTQESKLELNLEMVPDDNEDDEGGENE